MPTSSSSRAKTLLFCLNSCLTSTCCVGGRWSRGTGESHSASLLLLALFSCSPVWLVGGVADVSAFHRAFSNPVECSLIPCQSFSDLTEPIIPTLHHLYKDFSRWRILCQQLLLQHEVVLLHTHTGNAKYLVSKSTGPNCKCVCDNFQVFAHSELVLISHFGTVSYNTVIFIL